MEGFPRFRVRAEVAGRTQRAELLVGGPQQRVQGERRGVEVHGRVVPVGQAVDAPQQVVPGGPVRHLLNTLRCLRGHCCAPLRDPFEVSAGT